MDDLYYTIDKPARTEIKIKGSRFIGETSLVNSIEETNRQLAVIRKREHAATHHCYAYRVGLFDELQFKYSDDGEPGGTAGRPIYDVITGKDITNILLVVTRYFGGTKLGTGGLVRAYSEASSKALNLSGIKENYLTESIKVELHFSFYDQLVKLINRFSAIQKNADFSDHVSIELEVRKSKIDILTNAIIEITNGQAKIEKNPTGK